ncbi:nitroreductase family protein [Oricola sp.]|uniref:Acg family FMN-binding oxidoreductase n=1 Tax=Oricola sp. TaxID=1979950 RepID=UPI0025E6F18D|nr:nitroreductase family protein [Oricola sp.]MCI5078465.1 nitroreductase family protein [Oricola sp.]
MLNRRTVLAGAGAAAVVGAGAYALASDPSHDALAGELRAPRAPEADIASLVHFATLAANSHNTQPWLFSQQGTGIAVAPDLTRATPAADANSHHVFASLGCASENLALAAMAAGRTAAIDYAADDERVTVDLGADGAARDPLFDAIIARQCTRSTYDGRSVPTEDLKRIEATARMSGARLRIVTDRQEIEQVLEMVIAANTAQVGDPAFRTELKQWLRFSARRSVATRDGLYSPCSGNPAMPDWLARTVFDLVFTAKGENDRYAEQVRSSAGLAIVVSDASDKAHWVEAGRACQRFALAATALGIRHAFINQPLEVPALRGDFERWIGADVSPDLILRFGYAPPMPWSLRRPVEDVIV